MKLSPGPTTLAPRPASAGSYLLAESPLWDPDQARILWVDVLAGAVLEGRLAGSWLEVTRERRYEGMVGALGYGSGRILVARQRDLVAEGRDGSRSSGLRLIPDGVPARTNDGATDPAGRFLVGTTGVGGTTGRQALMRIDPLGVTVLDDDLGVSNGIGWSPDGSELYHVDTADRLVWVRPYDAASGRAGPRRVWVRFVDARPDGLGVDALGYVWIAAWGAGEVRRFTPEGVLDQVVALPAPHVSSLAFAGRDLDVLVISTARYGLSKKRLAAAPESGRLFTVATPVPGLPTTPWGGSDLPGLTPLHTTTPPGVERR